MVVNNGLHNGPVHVVVGVNKAVAKIHHLLGVGQFCIRFDPAQITTSKSAYLYLGP